MAIHTTTPPAQTSHAHIVIELIPLPAVVEADGVRYNRNLPAFVNDYYAKSHEIRELFPSLADRLRAATASNHQSLTHAGATDALMARAFFLTQEMMILARASEQQSRMQATLQSIDGGLAVKLDRVNAWKKVSAIFFTLAAAISAAAAVTAVNVNPKRTAAAAVSTAATVLLGAIGRGAHSLLKKPESAAKKNRDIIRAMVMGAKIIINNLNELASDLEYQTACIREMVDDWARARATDEYVREIMLALNKSFRKLQSKANRCSSEVSSATEAVHRSVLGLN